MTILSTQTVPQSKAHTEGPSATHNLSTIDFGELTARVIEQIRNLQPVRELESGVSVYSTVAGREFLYSSGHSPISGLCLMYLLDEATHFHIEQREDGQNSPRVLNSGYSSEILIDLFKDLCAACLDEQGVQYRLITNRIEAFRSLYAREAEKSERGFDLAKAMKVLSALDSSFPFFEILPIKDGVWLNRFAYGLDSNHHQLGLFISPGLYFNLAANSYMRMVHALILSPEAALLGAGKGQMAFNFLIESLLHEIGHKETEANLQKKIYSPYHGDLIRLNSQHKDIGNSKEEKPGESGYTCFTFDELLRYHKALVFLKNLNTATRSARLVYKSEAIEAHIAERAQTLMELSFQVLGITTFALEAMAGMRPLITSLVGNEELPLSADVNAVLEMGNIRLIIPLVKSLGRKDAKNRHLLEEHFYSLREIAIKHSLEGFKELYQLNMSDYELNAMAKIESNEELKERIFKESQKFMPKARRLWRKIISAALAK